MKNALDAMERANGKIIFNISESGQEVYIDITWITEKALTQNTKGCFQTGFIPQNKEGWGLGRSFQKDC